MDSLIVDLDKVLDDFEAEETGKKSCPGQESRPSEFSNYVALKEDRPWEDLSNVAITSDLSWTTGGTNHTDQMMAYDVPYSPSDQFDLSEADFAPLADYKTSLSENNSLSEKPASKPGHLVMNGDHKLDLGHVITNGSQDYKYPIQARDEFTPVYENQPFPPDLAHAISNGVNKSNLTYIQELGEKSDDIRSSLAYHSQTQNGMVYTEAQTDSSQFSVPPTYPSIDNSVDSGVNSIESNTALSPTNLEPLPPRTNNFTHHPVVGNVVPHTNSHAEARDQEMPQSLNRKAPNLTNKTSQSSLTQTSLSSHKVLDTSGMEQTEHISGLGSQGQSGHGNDKGSSLETNTVESSGPPSGLVSNRQTDTHYTETSDEGLSGQSEDTNVKYCDSVERNQNLEINSQDLSVHKASVGDTESFRSETSSTVTKTEEVKNSVGLSDTPSDIPACEGHLEKKEMVGPGEDQAVENVEASKEPTAKASAGPVGFVDSEVDLSDMESYLGDVCSDVATEKQRTDIHPGDSLIHSTDFTDSTGIRNQNSEIKKESDSIKTEPENQLVYNDVTTGNVGGQETGREQNSQDKGLTDTVLQSEHSENSEDPTVLTPLPPNMGARPKEPSQLVSGPSNQPAPVSNISPNAPAEQEVTLGEQSKGQGGIGQSEEEAAVIDTDSCVQDSRGGGLEEDMDPDLAMAIALSLQESGLEEAVMRPQGDGSQPPGRPHSWGPGEGVSHPQKRPQSLNLPARGEGGQERSSAPYTFPYPNSDQAGSEREGTPDASSMVDNQVTSPPVDEPAGAGYNPSGVGHVAPRWIPDSEAPTCMSCDMRFTFTKRRHHCRGCGKVFCSSCCNLKSRLPYMDHKEARVCVSCHQILEANGETVHGAMAGEAPAATTPAGVLKRDGTQRRHEPKQVIFSDGIRPGGDLTELDGSNKASSRLPLRRSGRNQRRVEKSSAEGGRRVRVGETPRTQCLIPETGIPPVVLSVKPNEELILEDNPPMEKYLPQIKDEAAAPVTFALCSNLHVLIKILSLDCCVNRVCWCFTTHGMCTVGQDEIVVILENLPEEDMIPVDIFRHLYHVYEEAGKGNTVSDMGHSIFTQTFLDDRDHGGFLYIKPTFQCLHKLMLPTPPYLFAILLQKWEMPWAKVFPIRLLLRLGAEYRYYPCPLISIRNRKPVFYEIGHTIMNLLADFRNFQYMLPQIHGITIHMQDKRTTINFPRNRYEDLMKVVENSNEHVMAIGACFSTEADSHLVCIQNDDGNYQTQAINIQNKPRKVTGASFVVFNGALKPSSGLKAKSSIVEDGLMVQITPESMAALKQAIKDMKDFTIGCGPLGAQAPDEVVLIQWVREDKHINIGVKSPVDGMAMDGITSVHIPHGTDYVGEHRLIRWTDVFFIENKDGGSREPVDVSRMAETLANAACIALTPHLDRLREANLVKIGLRVTLETDQVGYDIGANEEKLPDLYMNDLDNELIPVIHSAVPLCRGGSVVLELIFHILE